MKVFTPMWRKWATVLLGASLFIAPWIFGSFVDGASSANAWIVGACIVVATLRVPIVSGPRAAELIKVALGAWLLASPFALGFAGSDKELPESGPVRRLRLKIVRRHAAHSLARTREVIPPGVPHAWHRSRP